MKVVLEKYRGLGNDHLVFDPNKDTLKLSQGSVKLTCGRYSGADSDGVLEEPTLEKERTKVHIWNPDGSTTEKNGNGVRIFAKCLEDAGYVQKTRMTLSTLAGDADIQCLSEEGTRVKTSIDKVSFWSDEISVSGERREVVNETMIFGKIPHRATCTIVGNPHHAIFLNEISKDIMYRIGKNSESASYFPERANTQIMRVIDRQSIEIETYECGAGYTLVSGSSGCATTAMAYKQGLTDSEMCVKMPGGTLEIEILNDWTILITRDMGFVGTMQLGNILVEQLRALE